MKNLRLKAARAALDMSQAELAKRVNVSRQTIVAIEKGDFFTDCWCKSNVNGRYDF